MRLISLSLPLAAMLAAAPAAAQTADNDPDTIIVNVLRVPVAHDRVASSVTVLDLADIQAAQPLALTDVLQRTPGISVAGNGGYGAVSSLRIRGAAGEQTVYVIDGMRVADATAITGGFDVSQLFTDDFARVEILRGAQSVLWGSDAMGGVINVTTRAPTRPLEGDFSAEVGSHQTLSAHAGVGGTSPLLDWRISASDFTTAGIPTLAGGTVANGDSRQAASASANLHLASNVSLDLRGYWDNVRAEFSDDYTLPSGIFAGDYTLNKQWSLAAGLNVGLLDGRFKNRLALLQNQTDRESLDPANPLYHGTPALTFVGHGRIRRYEYQGSLNVSRGADLVFGAEREEARIEVGSPHTATTNSAYGEARVSPLKGLTLNGGVRYDHHSQFGGNSVFSAGAAYSPDGGTSLLRASYDEGFRAPSLYQLYSDYGNAALKPEHDKGWEVGAERALFGKALRLSATWYQRDSHELISFVNCPAAVPVGVVLPPVCGKLGSFGGYYANVSAARAYGWELAAALRLGRFSADANYSIVVAEDHTAGSPSYGQQLPHVPRHLANVTLGYDWTRALTTRVALRTSGLAADPYAPAPSPAYAVVDISGEWRLGDGLTLYGRVQNIADRHYQTVYGYNQLGRTAALGVRGRF